jgi:hypothetical protein
MEAKKDGMIFEQVSHCYFQIKKTNKIINVDYMLFFVFYSFVHCYYVRLYTVIHVVHCSKCYWI